MVDDPILYNGFGEYVTWDSHDNRSVYARSLPAIPFNCPTPMGVKGKKLNNLNQRFPTGEEFHHFRGGI